ncbi:MAG: UbiA family prenyltransferase [Candidatus Aminicenantia bacterium]
MIKNPYLRAMRVERWPRSLAIFVGIYFYVLIKRIPLFSEDFIRIVLNSLIAFSLTLLISLLNYIVNEFADAPFDVYHPLKRERPLVRGEVKKGALILIAISLFILSISLSLIIFNLAVTLSLLLLFLAGILYNIKPIRLKDIPFLDSISESANNPIRFLIGWFSSGTNSFPPLTILFFFWLFGNFILTAKRLSELRTLGVERARSYRKSFYGYSFNSLFVFIVISAVLTLGFFTIFSIKIKIISFLISIPLFAISSLWIIYKIQKTDGLIDEPEVLLRNPFFLTLFSLISLLILLALFIH